MSTFGPKIRELRIEKATSLRKFAAQIGISIAYLCMIERGKIIPTEDKIVKLAKALNFNQDELLSMAGKISSDLSKIILTHPLEYSELLRTVSCLSTTQIQKLTLAIRNQV